MNVWLDWTSKDFVYDDRIWRQTMLRDLDIGMKKYKELEIDKNYRKD